QPRPDPTAFTFRAADGAASTISSSWKSIATICSRNDLAGVNEPKTIQIGPDRTCADKSSYRRLKCCRAIRSAGSNCHRMIHRSKDPSDVGALRAIKQHDL